MKTVLLCGISILCLVLMLSSLRVKERVSLSEERIKMAYLLAENFELFFEPASPSKLLSSDTKLCNAVRTLCLIIYKNKVEITSMLKVSLQLFGSLKILKGKV